MGKWKAIDIESGKCIVRNCNSRHGYISIDGEYGFEQEFDHDQATRYALALNIVDAGVDLGEFPMRLLHFRGYRHRSESPNATSSEVMHKFFEALTYFETIANAVEGDKTKEDV